jgi:hypothetical protein
MPKSIFIEGYTPSIDSENIRLVELPIAQLPRRQKAAPKKPRKPRVPQVQKPKKKSTIVSRWKKANRADEQKSKDTPAIPEELIEEQIQVEKKKKRRRSKFHPREGEDEDPEEKALRLQYLKENAIGSDEIKRHNANAESKKRYSVVLDKQPTAANSTMKSLLSNNNSGMTEDIETLCKKIEKLTDKFHRVVKYFGNYSQYIPTKDLLQRNYDKKIQSAGKMEAELGNLSGSLRRTMRYLVTKACFETRNSRTTLGAVIEGLTWDPATLRTYQERKVHLGRTPPVRTYVEHEKEANAMISRHVTAIKGEIQQSIDNATPIEELCAAQTEMLTVYSDAIRNSKLKESEKLKYAKSLAAVRELMSFMVQEKLRKMDESAKLSVNSQ